MWRRMFPAEHFVECFYSTASIDSELESSQEYPKNFFFFLYKSSCAGPPKRTLAPCQTETIQAIVIERAFSEENVCGCIQLKGNIDTLRPSKWWKSPTSSPLPKLYYLYHAHLHLHGDTGLSSL